MRKFRTTKQGNAFKGEFLGGSCPAARDDIAVHHHAVFHKLVADQFLHAAREYARVLSALVAAHAAERHGRDYALVEPTDALREAVEAARKGGSA